MALKSKPLSSLTTDDVVIVVEMLGITLCEDQIRTNMIDGSALAVIESPSEFSYLGLILDDAIANTFFNAVQSYKKTGVVFDKSLRKSTQQLPQPSARSPSTHDSIHEHPHISHSSTAASQSSPTSALHFDNCIPLDLLQRSRSGSAFSSSSTAGVSTSVSGSASALAHIERKISSPAEDKSSVMAQRSNVLEQITKSGTAAVLSTDTVQTTQDSTSPAPSLSPVSLSMPYVHVGATSASFSTGNVTKTPSVLNSALKPSTLTSQSTTVPSTSTLGSIDLEAILNRPSPALAAPPLPFPPTTYTVATAAAKAAAELQFSKAKRFERFELKTPTDWVASGLPPSTTSPAPSTFTTIIPTSSPENARQKISISSSIGPPSESDASPSPAVEGLSASASAFDDKDKAESRTASSSGSGASLTKVVNPNKGSLNVSWDSSTRNVETHAIPYPTSGFSFDSGFQSKSSDYISDALPSYVSNMPPRTGGGGGGGSSAVNAIVSIGEVINALRGAVAEIDDPKLAVRAFDFIHLAVGDDPNRQTELGRVVGVESSIVKLLKCNINSPNICEYGCRAVCALAFDNFEICEKLGQAGICQVIGSILQEHASVAPVAEAICLAIKELAVFMDSENASQLGTKVMCELLVVALKMHMTDSNVVKAACLAVRALAYNSENRENLVDEGVCDYLVTALSTHVVIGSVVEAGALAVFNVCLSPEGRDIVGNMGGCEAVIKSLRQHVTVPDVAGASCRALCMLAQDNPGNKRRLNSLGVCDLVTVCLRNHARSPQVAEAACFTVKNLCDKEDLDSLMRFGGAGMCSLVALVLVNHVQHGSVIKSALFACANLALHADNINQLGDAGACEAVIQSLAVFASTPRIAEAGCQAIYQLSFNEANRSEFGEGGGCDLVCNIIKMHMLVPETVAAACRSLCILAFKHAANKDLLSVLGACEHLVSVMKIHKSVAPVSEWACQAAANLCVHNSNNQTQLGDYGMCSVVVDLLVEHRHVQTVAEAALRAITILAEDNEMNLSELYGVGVCEATVDALKNLVEAKGVVEWALRAVITLAGRNTICKSAFGNAGACKVIVAAIKDHIEDANVCTWGWKAIYCLTENDYANSTKFSVTKAHEYVVLSLTTHESDSVASIWACKVVSILATYSLGNSVKLAATGACAAVVRVLWNHVAEEAVAEAGCRALSALADDDVENATVLCENSACEAVMHAITLHGTLVAVAEIGCRAIANLVRTNKESQMKLGDTGACDTLIALLLYHQNVPSVVAQALQVLYILADYDENKNKIITGGICKIVTLAIKTHINCIQVAVEGCRAVTVFARSETTRVLFRNFNTSRYLMDVMVAQVSDASAIVDACKALCVLGETGRTKALPIEPVIMALNAHISHADVASHACKLLHFLVLSARTTSEGKPLGMDTPSACNALIAALVAHTKDAKVAFQICRAVCTLTAIDNDVTTVESRFGNVAACSLMVKTIQVNLTDASLVEAACGAVNNICVNDLIRTILGDVGACEVILLMLASHRVNSTIISVGCTTLYNLSGMYQNKNRLIEPEAKKLLEEIADDSNLSTIAQDKAKTILGRFKSTFLFW